MEYEQIDEMTKEINDAIGLISKLGIKLGNAYGRIKELTKEVNNRDDEIRYLKQLNSEKEQQNKDLNSQLAEKEGDFRTVSSEKESLAKNYSNLQEACRKLSEEYKNLQENLRNTEKYNSELNNENNEIKKEFGELKERVDNYASLKVDCLIRAYSLFSSFGERTRNNLKMVFPTDSFLGFISNAMQWDRIAGIWEQAKRKIVNDDNEDLQKLKELFLILFEVYNAGASEAQYILIKPEIGSKYNSKEQVIKGQKSDGRVAKVFLEGYIFKKNNNIHQAMVEVE